MSYLASNRRDIYRLAHRIRLLDEPARDAVLSEILAAGLMLAPGPLGWLFALLRRRRAMGVYVRLLRRRRPAAAEGVWEATLWHMTRGRDRFDRNSAGGFSQGEIDQVVGFVEAAERGFHT